MASKKLKSTSKLYFGFKNGDFDALIIKNIFEIILIVNPSLPFHSAIHTLLKKTNVNKLKGVHRRELTDWFL